MNRTMSGWSAPLNDARRAADARDAGGGRDVQQGGNAGRRAVLKGLAAAVVACGCRPIVPAMAAAGNAGPPAFGAGSLAAVLTALDAAPQASADLSLEVPDFVENGAVVPVTVTSRFGGAQEIFIISEANPFPLVARFAFPDGTLPFVATRIKVARSCNVYALVHTDGRFYSAVKATEVTVGGCGA
jgi:sulfur-oxidizing protein SoxY